jgi:AAA family ATP:ADP antiporter
MPSLSEAKPPMKNDSKKSVTILQSATLFVNFFLIITALYQLKPASRSQILEVLGANDLPYVWIGSALTLLLFINVYNRILRHVGRFRVVLGTALLAIVALAVFRIALEGGGRIAPVAFYIFVDLVGVILVEQFWSLANSIYSTREGKNWYGMIGTGGLLGGVTGSALGAYLIHYTPLQTPDLLLVGAAIIGLIFLLTLVLSRRGFYRELTQSAPKKIRHTVWPYQSGHEHHRYLLLIAAALLMAQLVSPLVEFQFMKIVEVSFPEREIRTANLSLFFSVLSGFSIVINLLVTPVILNRLGVLAGLLVQPMLLAVSAMGFMLHTGFLAAAVMKIADRGLSYSITRSSKELLYIPVDKLMMYQAKAWIDMFGYRTFKVAGALTILVLTQWTALEKSLISLNWVIVICCGLWMLLLVSLYRRYRMLTTPAKPCPAT